MAKPVTVPNTFATASSTIPLVNLDQNYTSLVTALNDYQTYANYGVDAGTLNALSITLNPAPTNQASLLGVVLTIKIANTNTNAVTLNVNGFGALSVTDTSSNPINGGLFVVGNIISVVFNGTNYVWQNSSSAQSNLSRLQNFTAVASAGALTITIAANVIDFRNSTLSSGVPQTVSYSSTTLTIPSGATLGAPAAITSASATMAGTTTLTLVSAPSAPVQVGAIIFQAGVRIGKVASLGTYVGGVGTGTVVLDASATFTTQAIVIINPALLLVVLMANGTLGVMNQSGGLRFDGFGLISTTAISAGSTANNVIYSTAGQTSQPYRLVGFIDVANSTVGTYVTPEFVQTCGAVEFAMSQTVGVGQTWQNVASQRVLGQTYTNIQGRPIQISIGTNHGVTTTATLTVGGVVLGTNSNANVSGMACTFSAVVPPGATYIVTATVGSPTVNQWAELF